MSVVRERLPGALGVKIAGVELDPPISAKTLRDLVDCVTEHGFLVLPGQSLSNDQYVAFGKRWGDPVFLIAKNNRLGSHPEMIRQSNSAATPGFVRNVANHWHCDSSYEEKVATFTMLLGVEAPDDGGETLFADLAAAWDALSPEDQARYEGMRVMHATSAATPMADEYIVDQASIPEEIKRDVVVLDPVTHPLVQTHPITGRKALYGLGGSAYGIEGLDPAEGSELILKLRRYATQERFRSSYKLMPGDVLIWDNFRVMHRATPIEFTDEPGRRRLNYRISVKGVPAEY